MIRKIFNQLILIFSLIGLFLFLQSPNNVKAADYFDKNEVVCQEIVDLGFTTRVYVQGNTARIEYKSEFSDADGDGRESVLVNGNIIFGRTIRVYLTYVPEGPQKESIKESWDNLIVSELYKQKSGEILEENISTDVLKSIILRKDSGSFSEYRFRRDRVFGEFNGVISISAPSLDSRVTSISVQELLEIIEKHGRSLLLGNDKSEDESDNIAEALEEMNIAVEFLRRRIAAGDSDEEIARLVNSIVAERVQPINNIWVSPWKTIYNFIFGGYENSFVKWRDKACFNYDLNAIWTWHNRIGQCEEFAQLSYYLLSKAGIPCNMYATDQHAFVIINEERSRIEESRDFGENTLVVDPWQKKVLNGKAAYENEYLLNNGKSYFIKTTQLYKEPIGYEEITSRNIVWDIEKKIWVPKNGYIFKYDKAQAWVGYAIKVEEKN